MHPDPTSAPPTAALLRRALAHMEEKYRHTGSATIADLCEPLGARSGALAVALLALPFLSPVSLGPVTTPASAVMLVLGWRLARQREAQALPERLLRVPVPRPVHTLMQRLLPRLLGWLTRLARPRHTHLVSGRRGRVFCGVGIVVGALLLAVPIPLLPLTNTIPALAILAFVLGWVERDGLLTLLGIGLLVVAKALFTAIGVGVALVGWEAVRSVGASVVPLLG